LRYFLLSSSVRDRLVDSTEAATKSRSRIRPEDVLQLEIPLPPIGEQRRIALILDQADELRKLHERADAKAEAIIPALFLKLFGDPLALTSSRDAVTVGQLKIQFQNGFACGEKDVDGGIPHLRMNNINDSGTLSLTVVRRVPADREQERYRLRTGDVLFMSTNSEDKVGKACVFYPPDNGSYLFSNHLIRLRIAEERLSPEYLATYLHLLWRRGFFRSVAKRWVNQATVSANALRQVRVHVPREGTAEEFSHQARALLTDSSRRETQRTQVERLFAVLSGRAFRGELTGKWREAHMSELLLQMEQQTRVLSTTGARGASA
jgi:type I restriction enzyme S subunit